MEFFRDTDSDPEDAESGLHFARNPENRYYIREKSRGSRIIFWGIPKPRKLTKFPGFRLIRNPRNSEFFALGIFIPDIRDFMHFRDFIPELPDFFLSLGFPGNF